jgi:hypothetical protein
LVETYNIGKISGIKASLGGGTPIYFLPSSSTQGMVLRIYGTQNEVSEKILSTFNFTN